MCPPSRTCPILLHCVKLHSELKRQRWVAHLCLLLLSQSRHFPEIGIIRPSGRKAGWVLGLCSAELLAVEEVGRRQLAAKNCPSQRSI